MTASYDSILVLISVLVAIVGAYASFDLVIRIRRESGPLRRKLLAIAAAAIGGSVWTMHFVAMLAVQLPMEMHYDILVTLVSAMVAILITACALGIISTGPITNRNIVISGNLMGFGIAIMHYLGMSGMHGTFTMAFDSSWIFLSVVIGIVASTMSFWLVLVPNLRGILRRLVSATVMGLSVSGVHYAGMLGTTFEAASTDIAGNQPILNQFSLGIITAFVTFAFLSWFLLILLPESEATTKGALPDTNHRQEPASLNNANAPSADTHTTENAASDSASSTENRIPVQKNKKTVFIDLSHVASVSADGHYSTVTSSDGEQHFCNYAFNKLLTELNSKSLFRVHRSHAINLSHVNSFEKKHDKGEVGVGDSEHKIPVSRTHVAKLQEALQLVRVKAD